MQQSAYNQEKEIKKEKKILGFKTIIFKTWHREQNQRSPDAEPPHVLQLKWL